DVLRESAVAGRSGSGLAVGAVKGRQAVQLGGELIGISQIVGRVLGEDVERLWCSRKRATQHRLMNEVHAELRRVPAFRSAHVVLELVFLLVAQDGERRNWRDKLVVPIGLKAGDSFRG